MIRQQFFVLKKEYEFTLATFIKQIISTAILRINHVKEQLKALEERVVLDKINTRYRVAVVGSNGNKLEMEKSRELTSEFYKDEFTRKKIVKK